MFIVYSDELVSLDLPFLSSRKNPESLLGGIYYKNISCNRVMPSDLNLEVRISFITYSSSQNILPTKSRYTPQKLDSMSNV